MIGVVLVGGASRRMGLPKAELLHPDGGTLAEHAVKVLRDGGANEVWLVGRRDRAPALPGVTRLDDAADDAGPLGGLVAALERAASAPHGPWAIVLACDLPYVTADDVRDLASAPAHAPAAAPRRGGRWEPLFARYDGARVAAAARERLARGERSLQGLLDAVGAMEHRVRDPRRLDDWDTPEDSQRPRP